MDTEVGDPSDGNLGSHFPPIEGEVSEGKGDVDAEVCGIPSLCYNGEGKVERDECSSDRGELGVHSEEQNNSGNESDLGDRYQEEEPIPTGDPEELKAAESEELKKNDATETGGDPEERPAPRYEEEGSGNLGSHVEPPPAENGSLLRFFRSELFEAYHHMHYLFLKKTSGVHEYLINKLYIDRTSEEIYYYLPQLCQFALTTTNPSSITRFFLDKASSCIHFALQLSWMFSASSEDRISDLQQKGLTLNQEVEMAVVNCKPMSGASTSSTYPDHIKKPDLFERHILLNKMYENVGITEREKSPSFIRIPTYFKLVTKDIVIPKSVVKIPNLYSRLGNPMNLSSFQVNNYSAEMREELQVLLMKQRRCDYFNALGNLVNLCMDVSSQLCSEINTPLRLPLVTRFFMALNEWILLRRCAVAAAEGIFFYTGLTFPLQMFSPKPGKTLQILRIIETEGKIFFSRTRAPFIMVLEVADLDEDINSISEFVKSPVGSDVYLSDILSPNSDLPNIEQSREHLSRLRQEHFYVLKAIVDDLFERKLISREELEEVGGDYVEAIRTVLGKVEDDDNQSSSQENGEKSGTAESGENSLNSTGEFSDLNATMEKLSTSPTTTPLLTPPVRFPIDLPTDQKKSSSRTSTPTNEPISDPFNQGEVSGFSTKQIRNYFWGENLEEKKKRFREQSPYGKLKTWDIKFVIIKARDSLRQERLTLQIIEQFKIIFERAKLPLWLKTYEILITGPRTGIIEFLPGTCSVDFLKRKFKTDSIAKVFDVAFKDCKFEAKKNFIESHAAYSIVSYILQIKDRHNGNMLIDTHGHVIHIDFGFMLSNSPGNLNFENAPFKLTQEYLDIMDGENSDNFEYFKTLIIRGFLEARKHLDRIVLLIEKMTSSCKLPCLYAGLPYILKGMHSRFMVNLPEEVCIERIIEMIEMSINNFRTIQYDNFQRLTNGYAYAVCTTLLLLVGTPKCFVFFKVIMEIFPDEKVLWDIKQMESKLNRGVLCLPENNALLVEALEYDAECLKKVQTHPTLSKTCDFGAKISGIVLDKAFQVNVSDARDTLNKIIDIFLLKFPFVNVEEEFGAEASTQMSDTVAMHANEDNSDNSSSTPMRSNPYAAFSPLESKIQISIYNHSQMAGQYQPRQVDFSLISKYFYGSALSSCSLDWDAPPIEKLQKPKAQRKRAAPEKFSGAATNIDSIIHTGEEIESCMLVDKIIADLKESSSDKPILFWKFILDTDELNGFNNTCYNLFALTLIVSKGRASITSVENELYIQASEGSDENIKGNSQQILTGWSLDKWKYLRNKILSDRQNNN